MTEENEKSGCKKAAKVKAEVAGSNPLTNCL